MKMLKKVLKVSIGIACACMLCVSLAMADTSTFTCTSNSCGSLDFRCSKNVRIVCNSDGQNYAAISDHYSGDKVYGITSGSSVIYYNTKTKGKHYATDGFDATDTADFANWSSL